MAQVSFFSKAAALSMVLFLASLAALVSAQDMDMAPAPSPSLVTGAGFSAPVSGAVVVAALSMSLMGLLKM